MSGMKIQVICENCGTINELKSTQNGHQVQLWRLEGFRVDAPVIEKNGDLEDITEIDEVDTELKEIRINCGNCDDFIVIEP